MVASAHAKLEYFVLLGNVGVKREVKIVNHMKIDKIVNLYSCHSILKEDPEQLMTF